MSSFKMTRRSQSDHHAKCCLAKFGRSQEMMKLMGFFSFPGGILSSILLMNCWNHSLNTSFALTFLYTYVVLCYKHITYPAKHVKLHGLLHCVLWDSLCVLIHPCHSIVQCRRQKPPGASKGHPRKDCQYLGTKVLQNLCDFLMNLTSFCVILLQKGMILGG